MSPSGLSIFLVGMRLAWFGLFFSLFLPKGQGTIVEGSRHGPLSIRRSEQRNNYYNESCLVRETLKNSATVKSSPPYWSTSIAPGSRFLGPYGIILFPPNGCTHNASPLTLVH
jgi:hypothetical protein